EGMHKAASKLSLEYLLRVVSQPYRRILLVLVGLWLNLANDQDVLPRLLKSCIVALESQYHCRLAISAMPCALLETADACGAVIPTDGSASLEQALGVDRVVPFEGSLLERTGGS